MFTFHKTLAVALLSVLGAVPVVRAQQPIVMEFNNWLASTGAVSVGAFEPWKKLVEERTKGRIKVNLYHGGVLGGSRAVLDDVRGGVYHVGFLVPTYYFDSPLFMLTVGQLPFSAPSAEIASKVMNEFEKKHRKEIFEKLGVISMGAAAADPYLILSTRPIRTLPDMKGLRLRASGKDWVPIIKGWGAEPTSMQPEEAYTALERGTMDAMLYTPTGALGWKYHEVAPYITDIQTPTIVAGMIMNKAWYAKLPDDLKKLFDEELNQALMNMITSVYQNGRATAIEKMTTYFKARGKGEIIHLTPEEKAKFVATTKPAWDDFVTEANKRGWDGEALLADYKAILRKNGVTPPF